MRTSHVPALLVFCQLLLSPALAGAADAPRQDIVTGTGSSEIYHYYDTRTNEKVWGIQNKPYVDNPPETPVIVKPEINFPWPYPGNQAPGGGFPPKEPR